jgi:hypothetical protein
MNTNRGTAGGQLATIKPQDGAVLPVGELMERILAAGDVAALSAGDRAHYLIRVAESAGLNPLSQPFDLIPGPGGKLKLYPNKSATDQLRKMYRLRTIMRGAREEPKGIYVVEVEVTDGIRTETNIGAVPIAGLQGEALANAMMKAHTKAKRRGSDAEQMRGGERDPTPVPASDRQPVHHRGDAGAGAGSPRRSRGH